MKVAYQGLSRLLSITLVLAVALGITAVALPAGADDLNPPPWRGQFGTTSQEWLFNQPGSGPPDGFSHNPYGSPWFIPTADWGNMEFGRQGFYRSPQALLFEIPNRPFPNDQKIIRVQVTWWGDPLSGLPLVVTIPAGALQPPQVIPTPDGWWHGTWDFVLPFNPPFETIEISGLNILVDQVVIDTWCVPEPGSLLALAGGLTGMAAAFRRRR